MRPCIGRKGFNFVVISVLAPVQLLLNTTFMNCFPFFWGLETSKSSELFWRINSCIHAVESKKDEGKRAELLKSIL
jgi:hypothetical protein